MSQPTTAISRLLRATRPGWLLGLILLPLLLSAETDRTFRYETVATFGWLGVADEEPPDFMAGTEIRFPQNWQGIRPWLGVSVVDNGTWFAGAGFVYDFRPSPDWVITLGTGPFYYKNEHHNLGLDLEFYSFLEATRRFRHDVRLGLRVGHLSNGGLGRQNPGTEDVVFVAVVPLTRSHAKAVRTDYFSTRL